MNENKEKREVKVSLPLLIAIIAIIIVGAVFGLSMFFNGNNQQIAQNPNNEIINNENSGNNENANNNNNEIISDVTGNEDESGNVADDKNNTNQNNANKKGISDFDLSFLKLENQKENKIYSPLSIKYALNMLAEGASGESKEQITNVIGKSDLTKYASNSNMSLANALFVRDTFASAVKENYKNALKEKYEAEVIADSFETPDNVNSWVSEKTLNLINNLLPSIEGDTNYLLINALGIDMEWNNKFLSFGGEGWEYLHEKYYGDRPQQVSSKEFGETKQLVSGMEFMASINNYDIVEELGRDNIIKIVSDEYRAWARNLSEDDWEYEGTFNSDLSEENIDKQLEYFLYGKEEDGYKSTGYLEGLDSNYGKIYYSTDFAVYEDETIKAFAKDLKEYDGTTLQYVGIMPLNEELDVFVNNIDETKINNIVNNLKDLKAENFKEGVLTEIKGYIPKFDFEYELRLKEDLESIGITNVFTEGKANLTEITNNENDYIANAIHKANIEFTQDGIKAAAVTNLGGLGGGEPWDYKFDVPVEKIDMTFDKPYMFLIRDKETGEIWFTGTVYEPLAWENEARKDLPSGT